jgi:predicted CXXCH cytochrome family protein
MKGTRHVCGVILVGLLVVPSSLWAKAHDECAMCHGDRLGIGLAVFTKKRQIAIINPNTGKELERIEAICLNCHGDEEYKAQLKELGAEIALLEDEPEANPEGTTTPLDEMMLAPVDVGFRIIDLHESHPVGIAPKKVVLPKEASGFKWQENQLTCISCHDHHPSNTNYKYLRWPTDNGNDMNSFCAHCHSQMIEPEEPETPVRRKRGMGPISGD